MENKIPKTWLLTVINILFSIALVAYAYIFNTFVNRMDKIEENYTKLSAYVYEDLGKEIGQIRSDVSVINNNIAWIKENLQSK